MLLKIVATALHLEGIWQDAKKRLANEKEDESAAIPEEYEELWEELDEEERESLILLSRSWNDAASLSVPSQSFESPHYLANVATSSSPHSAIIKASYASFIELHKKVPSKVYAEAKKYRGYHSWSEVTCMFVLL